MSEYDYLVKAELRAAAIKAGIHDYRDLHLLDLGNLTTEAMRSDGTVNPRAIDAFVTNLKAERAYWFADVTPASQKKRETPQPIDWAKMSAAERTTAEAALFADIAADVQKRAATAAKGPRELTAAEQADVHEFLKQFRSRAEIEYAEKLERDREAAK